MIKFFRKIRQRLLTENKFSKYMLYAIGEIVLVVIGILIALQINNWNEQRKLQAKEIELLQNFKNTLNRDITSLTYYIEEFGTIHSSINVLMKYMKEDLPFEESLNFHFLNSTAYWSPGIDQGVFETLTSTDLNIISNDSLKKSIVDYYAYANRDFEPQVSKYQNVIDNASRNIFNTRFDTFWNVNKRAMIPHDYESLKTDKEYYYFISSLDNQLFWLVENPLNGAESRAKDLLKIIDNELQQFKN
jgi:Family of unknown function (DUF6090)